MADRVGFEPTQPLKGWPRLSRTAQYQTLSTIHKIGGSRGTRTPDGLLTTQLFSRQLPRPAGLLP